MERWYKIIQSSISSHKRFLSMVNLIQDIVVSYPDRLMIIHTEDWSIEILPFTSPIRVNEAFRSTSVLKSPEKHTTYSSENWQTKSATLCQRDYQLFEHFSKYVNMLNVGEREVFIKKYVYRWEWKKVVEVSYISKTKYYELCKSMESKLIYLCGFEYYDFNGIIKNWKKYEEESLKEV